MSIIIAILIGALVGLIAAKITGRDQGFVGNVLTGIVGAFLGNVVSRVLVGGEQASLQLDLSGILWSLGGAVILCLILNAITNHRRV